MTERPLQPAILDYGAGNLTSVANACAYLGHPARITRDPAAIAAAPRVIFPGQGAAGPAMAHLRAAGLDTALRAALAAGRPVLGICIAHQLIFEHSAENGGTTCLGLLPGTVARFDFPRAPAAGAARLKVPHMGWNAVHPTRAHPLFAGLRAGREAYFVHSYYPEPADEAVVLARSEYGGHEFVSAVARDNLVAVQFHPEKSGQAGLVMLSNFLTWEP